MTETTPIAPVIDALLEQAQQAARQQGISTRLEHSLAWYSPAAERIQQAAVTYELAAHGPSVLASVAGLQIDLSNPVALSPVAIAKPWGQEVWFTGMEARGEAAVQINGAQLPLPLYLALAPTWLHQQQPVVLLKILDPKPEPLVGDLYFEVHEHKEEIYVVTAVNREAWPTGVGAIRYGVNQDLRRQLDDDARFRSAYLAAVQGYERVRRRLDAEPTASHAGDADLKACWSDPQALAALEAQRRTAMEAFTELLPLQVGDIVRVPPWHPHALQHGVQVVEFQTPTYERFIISFAQQVLTQAHWDSATAIERMSLEALSPGVAGEPPQPPGITRIADYGAFGALRVDLDACPDGFRLNADLPYVVAICIQGSVACGELLLRSGDACFVPSLCLAQRPSLQARAAQTLVLLAAPGL